MFNTGDLVRLINQAAVNRFGEGPFTVSKVNKSVNAVEVDEIGTVSINDLALWDAPISHTVQHSSADETEHPSYSLSDTNITHVHKRIEVLSGQLLSSSDVNAVFVGREILRLLWEVSKETL